MPRRTKPLVVQHRVNDHKQEKLADFAEIDVWLCDNGQIRLKHDVVESNGAPPILLSDYLARATFNGYFLNIKQALSFQQLNRILKEFKNPEMVRGVFDIPFPLITCYASIEAPVFKRVSEWEGWYPSLPVMGVWIDPLKSYDAAKYLKLFGKAHENSTLPSRFYFACPSLHGLPINECEPIWRTISVINYYGKPIAECFEVGIVTKHPREAREILGD
jgi:hypothetical protein